jgi:hypothetical protein
MTLRACHRTFLMLLSGGRCGRSCKRPCSLVHLHSQAILHRIAHRASPSGATASTTSAAPSPALAYVPIIRAGDTIAIQHVVPFRMRTCAGCWMARAMLPVAATSLTSTRIPTFPMTLSRQCHRGPPQELLPWLQASLSALQASSQLRTRGRPRVSRSASPASGTAAARVGRHMSGASAASRTGSPGAAHG